MGRNGGTELLKRAGGIWGELYDAGRHQGDERVDFQGDGTGEEHRCDFTGGRDFRQSGDCNSAIRLRPVYRWIFRVPKGKDEAPGTSSVERFPSMRAFAT